MEALEGISIAEENVKVSRFCEGSSVSACDTAEATDANAAAVADVGFLISGGASLEAFPDDLGLRDLGALALRVVIGRAWGGEGGTPRSCC